MEVSGQFHGRLFYTSEEEGGANNGTLCMGGLVGPRDGMETVMSKISWPLPGIET
jgi:hypothetical protein